MFTNIRNTYSVLWLKAHWYLGHSGYWSSGLGFPRATGTTDTVLVDRLSDSQVKGFWVLSFMPYQGDYILHQVQNQAPGEPSLVWSLLIGP